MFQIIQVGAYATAVLYRYNNHCSFLYIVCVTESVLCISSCQNELRAVQKTKNVVTRNKTIWTEAEEKLLVGNWADNFQQLEMLSKKNEAWAKILFLKLVTKR